MIFLCLFTNNSCNISPNFPQKKQLRHAVVAHSDSVVWVDLVCDLGGGGLVLWVLKHVRILVDRFIVGVVVQRIFTRTSTSNIENRVRRQLDFFLFFLFFGALRFPHHRRTPSDSFQWRVQKLKIRISSKILSETCHQHIVLPIPHPSRPPPLFSSADFSCCGGGGCFFEDCVVRVVILAGCCWC